MAVEFLAPRAQVPWQEPTTTAHAHWVLDLTFDSLLPYADSSFSWSEPSSWWELLNPSFWGWNQGKSAVRGSIFGNNWEVHFSMTGIMALIALVSSALSISTIIKQGHRNPFQKVKNYIQWMLAMIPVYSWCSVLALAISQSNIHWFEFFVMIREFFESLVILSFIQFLLHFMITLIEEERSEGLEARYHAFIIYHEPEAQCCGMVNWKRGPPFISRTIVGGLQFVVCAIVDVVLRLFAFVARFGLGHTDWSTYLLGAASFIRNASQSWALFCMFYFYMATVKRLHPINPELKFIAVKGVVFFTYWQGLALFIAEYFNALDPKYLFASENSFFKMEWENGEQVSSAINNMLIVIEMLGFAILHMVAFNPDEFATASREQQQAVIAEGATRDERDKMEETENLRDEIVHLQKRKSQTTMRPRPIVQLSQIPEGSEEGQEGEDERKEGEGLFGPKSGAQSSRGSGGGAAAAAASSSQGFTGGTSDPMPAPMHQPMPASPTGMGGLGEDQIEDALQNRVEALGVVMSEIAAGGEGGGEGGMAGAAGAGLNSNEGTVENSSEAASGEAIVEKAAAIVFDRQAQETKQANTNQKKMDAWNERFSSGFGLNDFFYAFFYCEPIPDEVKEKIEAALDKMDARERGTGEDGVAFDTQEYHTPLDNLPNFMLNEVRAQKMRMNEVILAEWRAERAQKPEIDRAFKIVEKFDAEMGGTLQSQVMGMKDYVPPSIENPQHQRGLQGALSRVANRPGGVLHGGIKIVRNENGGLATRGALREGKEGVGLFAYGGPRQVRGDHERRTNRGLGSRGLFLGRSARDNKELQARASVTASPRTLQDTNAASAQAAERSEEIEMSAPGAGVGFGLDSSPSERGNTVSPPESQPLLGSSGQQ